jgi:hypothetical protein
MTEKPFATVLESMARELDRLANLAGHIDTAVGRVPISADLSGDTLAALQRVDFLRQSLECLTIYVGNLSGQVNDTIFVNPASAAAALPLRDLAHDLVGNAGSDSQAMQTESHDTCFF